MKHLNIEISIMESTITTKGLNEYIGYELSLDSEKLREERMYVDLLVYIIDYIKSQKVKILPNETFGYHSWPLIFKQENKKYLKICEISPDGDGFTPGVENTLNILEEQKMLCDKMNCNPIFPQFNQQIVISKGVYEGLSVEAVRYPSPSRMTGWWVTTDLYDDDIKSLMVVHYYHVAFQRPDLLKYMALKPGFKFDTHNNNECIWFDEKALEY